MEEALGDPSQNERSAEDIIEQAVQNKLSDVIRTMWYFTKGSKTVKKWNVWKINAQSNVLLKIVLSLMFILDRLIKLY